MEMSSFPRPLGKLNTPVVRGVNYKLVSFMSLFIILGEENKPAAAPTCKGKRQSIFNNFVREMLSKDCKKEVQ